MNLPPPSRATGRIPAACALRVVLPVRQMQPSLDFYIGGLGMCLVRRVDIPGDRLTHALLGFGCEADRTVLELRHHWGDAEASPFGSSCAHLAVAVDIDAVVARLAEYGVAVTPVSGSLRDVPGQRALVEDPDGHVIELFCRSSGL